MAVAVGYVAEVQGKVRLCLERHGSQGSVRYGVAMFGVVCLARYGSHGYAWWCTSGKARSGVAVVVLCVASGCGWSDEERYGSPGKSR